MHGFSDREGGIKPSDFQRGRTRIFELRRGPKLILTGVFRSARYAAFREREGLAPAWDRAPLVSVPRLQPAFTPGETRIQSLCSQSGRFLIFELQMSAKQNGHHGFETRATPPGCVPPGLAPPEAEVRSPRVSIPREVPFHHSLRERDPQEACATARESPYGSATRWPCPPEPAAWSPERRNVAAGPTRAGRNVAAALA